MKPSLTPEEVKERKRRKRERWIILVTIGVVIGLTVWETRMLRPDFPFSTTQRVVLFALININIILLLLLIFLVVRNLLKLVTERRSRILGSKIRTRLVLAFVTLSLVPTILLFLIAYAFMTTGMDYWFNIRIERSLQDSLDVGRAYYQASQKATLVYARQIGQDLSQIPGLTENHPSPKVLEYFQDKKKEYGLAWMGIFLPDLKKVFQEVSLEPFARFFNEPSLSLVQKGLISREISDVQSTPAGDFFLAGVPVRGGLASDTPAAVVVVATYFPKSLMNKMETISAGLEGYRQMQMLKNPVKFIYLIILSIVSLLIIFSATWFGFYLAKGITGPVQKLAEGTFRIAQGDYNFSIDLPSKDEFGLLVDSFNKMTSDLRRSREEIDRTTEELRRSNEEINRRRRYMEIVLTHIGSGVIAIDAQGRLTTMNHAAQEMLGLQAEKALGRFYQEILGQEHTSLLRGLLANLDLLKKGTIERTVTVPLADRNLRLLVKISFLQDAEGKSLGWVLVFDDLSELEKIQRVSAWKEVARRLAHEIKNPLTPIKLSAQRLQRRYASLLAQDQGKGVFDECTTTIIHQVDELIGLVNEFSAFARLPSVNLSRQNLNQLIQEVLVLYEDNHKTILFSQDLDPELPPFSLDREQIKRVMINLLDNAVAAVGETGSIRVETEFFPDLKIARVQVADTGVGIDPQVKDRLFEPYFSTKKGGTGLGLTIASSIISDHHGHIRVKANHPRGTIFMVELPLEA
jgi:two-component system nitrogen regulation sensor histidine kinase NtrY